MKKTLIISKKFRIIICLLLIMISCNKEEIPTPIPCNISGTHVNMGSTAGGIFGVTVGTVTCPSDNVVLEESIVFSNIDLNFWVTSQVGSSCPPTSVEGILNAGLQTCLDFTYSGSPSAPKVSLSVGHGYVGQFSYGHIVKFIVKSYTNGIANIEYILQ